MDDSAPLMHVDWIRWFALLKRAVETPVDASLIVGGQPLTGVDDTNVTLTLGGTPATALLTSVEITLGWTGTLAAARLNANVVQSVTNDTNVTGSIAAQDLTLGWTGTLSVARGGTGLASYAVGDLLYASGATTLSKLADVAAGSYLRSGGVTTAPVWSTLKLPNAATTGDLVYASSANTLIVRTIGNAADVLTVAGGVPTWAAPAASGTSVIVDDTTTNATMYPTWVTAASGSLPLKVSSTKLSFNPSTGVLALATPLVVTSGGTGTGTAFTAGSIVFAGASGVYAQSNAKFFWDNTNQRLGFGDVGTTTPATTLHLVSTASAGQFRIDRGSGSISLSWVLFASNLMTVTPATTNASRIWYQVRQADYGAASPICIGEADSGFPGIGYNVIFGDTANAYTYTATDRAYLIDMGSNSRIGIKTAASGSAGAAITFTERLTILQTGNVGVGETTPTAVLHLKAGTASASTAPLKFTSGTNLTTAEAGAMEYNGTNLFFTRAGTVRENVLVVIDNVAAPTTSIGVAIVNYYGANATNYLGDPNRWLSVNVLGATYKIPLYT